MDPVVFRLKNDIRVIYQPSGGNRISHIALMVQAGTRNERKGKEGLAHFLEHVFFKGTRKRKSFHILNRLDGIGGELNAFTSKEETCLYASVMSIHTERAFELLSDIFFNSVFPEKELEKEKQVIIDEIRTYEDTPSEQILDDFEGQVYQRHALGNPVLGTLPSINAIKREDILNFIQTNYTGKKIVLSVVTDIPEKKIKALAEKHFSHKTQSDQVLPRKRFNEYKSNHRILNKPIAQSHVVIGNIAYSYTHPMRIVFALLNNILGGPGMNSRLNLHIREKYGYTYQIDSNFTPFSDTGIFNIYFATDKLHVDKTIALVYKELSRLQKEKINAAQLKRYKEQMIGQLTMSYENKAGLAVSAAKSLLCYNRIDTPEQLNKRIEAITSSQLSQVANEVFDKHLLSSLHFKPGH